MELIEQEFSPQPEIDIPGEVMDIYRLWRPTPLYRARRLEKSLDTPAHIYYKYEGASPAGSHKPNTAVPQAYYNKRAGIKRAGHRNRRRPVGQRAVAGLPAVRPGVHRLHGAGQLRPEALPPHDDAHLGRRSLPQPQPADQLRPRHPGRDAGFARQPRHRHQRGRGRRRHARRHQLRAGQRAQPRACCTRPSSARKPSCRWSWPAKSRMWSSAASAAAATSAGSRCPTCSDRLAGKGPRIVAVEPSACPSLTKGTLRLRLRRHRQAHAAPQDVHPGPRLRAARDPRRRPALSRRLPADQPPAQARARSRPSPTRNSRSSRPRCSSPAPKASCPRPNRRTPSAPRSMRPCRPARKGGSANSLLPERPRPLRPVRLRELPQRQVAGLRIPWAATWRSPWPGIRSTATATEGLAVADLRRGSASSPAPFLSAGLRVRSSVTSRRGRPVYPTFVASPDRLVGVDRTRDAPRPWVRFSGRTAVGCLPDRSYCSHPIRTSKRAFRLPRSVPTSPT